MLIDHQVDDFFSDEVAVDATYTPDGGQPTTTRVIFDRDYIEANQFGDSKVETKEIAITVKTSDYENAKQGETVEVNETTYYIINPQISEGISRIILSLNSPFDEGEES